MKRICLRLATFPTNTKHITFFRDFFWPQRTKLKSYILLRGVSSFRLII